jgi:hypothetical protein
MHALTDSFPARSDVATGRPGVLAPVRQLATRLWQEEPLLTAGGLFLLLIAIPSAAAIWLDPRLITGAPAWLKPTKFAVSTGVYAVTLAGVLTMIPEWRRTRRIVGIVSVVVMVLEVAIIDLQAWRGTTSHFNVGTPLDAALFSVMGLAIFTQTFTTIAVAVALWRQRFADRAMGWALRLGMTLTIIGALTGGLMTRPTAAQLADASAGQPLVRAGAHTIGAPDGGPGLPVTGWSTHHGDLRVPHFVGLHAIQTLPLFAVVIARVARRREDAVRTRLTIAAAAVYALAFVLLLGQALRGLPVIGGL